MGFIADEYDGSFDGTPFWIQSSSGMLPGRPIQSKYTRYDIPDSDGAVLIVMGKKGAAFSLTVAVEATELAALQDAVNGGGDLEWAYDTVNVRLVEIDPTPGKAGPFDAYTITLKFEVA